MSRVHPAPISIDSEPLDVLARWPTATPAIALISARPDHRRARWSVLAAPRGYLCMGRRSQWIGDPALAPRLPSLTHDPLRDLDAAISATRSDRAANTPIPFHGGWIGSFSYDLGRHIEPTAQASCPAFDDRGWPAITLAWCPGALVYDHIESQWWLIGDMPDLDDDATTTEVTIGALRPDVDPDDQRQAIAATIEAIAAGDIFQANITQRHSAIMQGSSRRLALAALQQSGAWYGAHLELPGGRSITSLSPELFLQVDATSRKVITRPIKGTRSADESLDALRDSAKDTAELNMIIDLMRNDLGRVCTIGSVVVSEPRIIETHPTVHHGVGQVEGTLRDDVGVADLLRATFPPGSVTGAPKIRAMQIIDELEPTRRGPYCGAIGFISNHGDCTLNVAIRTILVTTYDDVAVLDYSAGGGIVADSTPEAELRESLDKVEVLRLTLRALQDPTVVSPVRLSITR